MKWKLQWIKLKHPWKKTKQAKDQTYIVYGDVFLAQAQDSQ